MNRLIRIVLIWLLVLAIPAQGIAAGVRLSCGPMHPSSTLENVRLAPHSHELASANDQHQQHLYPHHHQYGMSQQANDGMSSSEVASAAGAHVGTCSACAACFVGAAMVASNLNVLPTAGNIGTRVARFSPRFTNFIPTGLERPPAFFYPNRPSV